MNRILFITACLLFASLASCGRHSTDGEVASAPDIVVTFDGPTGACEVSKAGDANKRWMPCLQVPSYLMNTLKIPPGSLFDYKTIPDVNVAEFERVMAELKAAGYQLTPGTHVGFLTEPKPRRENDGKPGVQ